MKQQQIVVVGAGLAGCLLTVYLAKRGYKVRVYERRPDPRTKGYVGGRSINLALSARGLWGLAGVGLDATVMRNDAIAMPGRMMHDRAGRTLFQPYSSNPKDAINSVSRGGLNLTLLNEAARMPGVELIFDHTCTDIDLDAPAAIFQTPSGSSVRIDADVVLGADGAFSPLRGKLQKTDRFEYSQTYLKHGYKELHIPPGSDGTYRIERNALHIWPRGGSMMIALPNRDGSFTCTLFWPFEGEHSFQSVQNVDITEFFREMYPDAVPLMPTLREDFAANPVGSLVTVRCWPWQHMGKVAVLGDAAHAIVPFYGQGMNCAFEDVRVFAELLDTLGGDFGRVLPQFQEARKANADAIADMALTNFVEMRDFAGRPEFQYRKKVEQTLHAKFPDKVHPQYNLVSFSTVPYVDAQRSGRELDGVVDAVIRAVPAAVLAEVGPQAWEHKVEQAAQAAWSASGGRADARTPTDSSIIDITPLVSERLGVWPGDTPPTRQVLCDMRKGDTITLSTLNSTVHLGAHADGPNHYGVDAASIDAQQLDHYLGPCHVLDAPVQRDSRVRETDIRGGLANIVHPRVLIRTGTFPNPESWNSDFAGLDPTLVDALASHGVRTIGIDTPSVDLQTSKDLPAHKAILRHGIAILEGLVLANVVPGEYELIALPLKLHGFDASPVRAVLRKLSTP